MEFNCSRAPCCSQSTNRSIPSFCTFENLARDVPARLMSFRAAWKELTCPFERKFHIDSHSRSKAVRKHDNPFCVRRFELYRPNRKRKEGKEKPARRDAIHPPFELEYGDLAKLPTAAPCMIGTSAPLQIFQIGVSRGRRTASSGKANAPTILFLSRNSCFWLPSRHFPG
jgi:hypothetical protein